MSIHPVATAYAMPVAGPAKPGPGRALGLAHGLAEGAQVRTPVGGKRVEFLRPGDLVVTREFGLMPLRFVLRIDVDGSDPKAAPVRLSRRALGPGSPCSDLWLAPYTRLSVPGWQVASQPDTAHCLIQAHVLAGTSDAAFVDLGRTPITYYGLVFDAHVTHAANGAWVESVLPCEASISMAPEAQRDGLMQRFPVLRSRPTPYGALDYPTVPAAEYCPPLTR